MKPAVTACTHLDTRQGKRNPSLRSTEMSSRSGTSPDELGKKAPLHKRRRSTAIIKSLLHLVPRKNSQANDFPNITQGRKTSRPSISDNDGAKCRRQKKSTWKLFTTMRSFQSPISDNREQLEVMSDTLKGSEHAIQFPKDKKLRPKRRKSLGDMLDDLANRFPTRYKTTAHPVPNSVHKSATQDAPEQTLNIPARLEHPTGCKIYGAQGIMSLAEDEGKHTTSEDMNAFQDRLEDLVNGFKLDQTKRLMGSLGSSASWQSQQTLQDANNNCSDASTSLQLRKNDILTKSGDTRSSPTTMSTARPLEENSSPPRLKLNTNHRTFVLPLRVKTMACESSHESIQNRAEICLAQDTHVTANTDLNKHLQDGLAQAQDEVLQDGSAQPQDKVLSAISSTAVTCAPKGTNSKVTAAATLEGDVKSSAATQQPIRFGLSVYSDLQNWQADITDSAGPASSTDAIDIIEVQEAVCRHKSSKRHVSFVEDVAATISSAKLAETKEAADRSSQRYMLSQPIDRSDTGRRDHGKTFVLPLCPLPSQQEALKTGTKQELSFNVNSSQLTEQRVEVRLPCKDKLGVQSIVYLSKRKAIIDLLTTYHDRINEFMTFDPINRIIQTYDAFDQLPNEQTRRMSKLETMWLPLKHSVILRDSASKDHPSRSQITSRCGSSSSTPDVTPDILPLKSLDHILENNKSVCSIEVEDTNIAYSNMRLAIDDMNAKIDRNGGGMKRTMIIRDCPHVSNISNLSAKSKDGTLGRTVMKKRLSLRKTWLDLGREYRLPCDREAFVMDYADADQNKDMTCDASYDSNINSRTGFKFTDYGRVLRERSTSSEHRKTQSHSSLSTDSSNAGASASFVKEHTSWQDKCENLSSIALQTSTSVTLSRQDHAVQACEIDETGLTYFTKDVAERCAERRHGRHDSHSRVCSSSEIDENTAPEQLKASPALLETVTCDQPHNNKGSKTIAPNGFNLRIVGKAAQGSHFARNGQKRVATLVDIFQAQSTGADATLHRPQPRPPQRYPELDLDHRSASFRKSQCSSSSESKSPPALYSRYERSSSGFSAASTQYDDLFGATLEQMMPE